MIYIIIVALIWLLCGILGFIEEMRKHYIDPDGIDVIMNFICCVVGGPIYLIWTRGN